MKNRNSNQKKIAHLLVLSFLLPIHSVIGQYSLDSLNKWIKESKGTDKSIEFRKEKLSKAYNLTLKIPEDSTRADRLIEVAYRYYKLRDTSEFLRINKQAEELASKLNSSYLLGYLHWDYGSYYKRYSNYLKAYEHYTAAHQHFKKVGLRKNEGRLLYTMSEVKGYHNDLTGAEQLAIRALKIFKSLKDNLYLFKINNYLGILNKDFKEYDKAFEYHEKAKEYYKKLNKKEQKKHFVSINNNIAQVFFKKKEYSQALRFYEKALQNKFINKREYTRIISNRALCKLKMLDTVGVRNDFFEAEKIRIESGNIAGILSSKIYLSHYYQYVRDTINALEYAKEGYRLAQELNNSEDYLETLQQLANIDRKNSKKYLDRYIEFNDSLISVERRIQNKFARIELETDEYIEETERLAQQRIWIIVTSIGSLLILSLLYFLRVQKVRNEKLRIEADNQKANEEVYILTLEQQSRVEEERVKERNRISEELHDGILGKLFGTRFGLGFLPLQGDEKTLEKHQGFLNELQDIEKEIREVSHKLSHDFKGSNINFTSIIKQLLEDKSSIGKFSYEVDFSQKILWKKLDEVTKANIYRIIQEALQNIIKHAKASHVSLHFNSDNQQLTMTIKDDGIGFETTKGKRGIGIKNIQSRIEKLKGSIKIESEINVGTTLHIKIPYHKKNGK